MDALSATTAGRLRLVLINRGELEHRMPMRIGNELFQW
jgi:hypothetical protein